MPNFYQLHLVNTYCALQHTTQMSFTWISHLRWLSAQGYCFTGLAGVEIDA
jgi:hypothetical protein